MAESDSDHADRDPDRDESGVGKPCENCGSKPAWMVVASVELERVISPGTIRHEEIAYLCSDCEAAIDMSNWDAVEVEPRYWESGGGAA